MNIFHELYELYLRVNSYCVMAKYKLMYPHHIKTIGKYYFRKGLILMAEGNITIGRRVFFNNFCSVNSKNNIFIGDDCIFGENVRIYDHNHLFDVDNNYIISGFTSAPIHIGNHCWISSNCTILKGVSIGENCIIGAGCVVYKDIPSNTVVINNQNLRFKQNAIK